ncbi:MG2 domain-containing protein, partial [Chitinimonas sp.]|uniref:MG2 domain-containing protein n=1 Tax=Chitinimonas sp. TaxID=1934313 RepID=UPI0035B323FD
MRFLKPILIAVSAVAVTATGVAAWRHHANPAAPSLLAALSSSASAPVASDAGGQADPNTPFVLVEAANRSFEGSPALALTVSQPLARQDFDSLIQVFEMSETPAAKKPLKAGKKAEAEAGDEEGEAITDTPEEDESSREQAKAKATTVSTAPADVDVKGGKLVKGGWVLGPNPRIVFFPNVKPQTRYVVVIKPGLKDGIDRTLKDEARYSIRTAAISPAYYFASNGMVLPAGQNGGLPVITVNVPEVDVQFLRVRKEQLPRFLEMVIAGPRKAAKPVNEDGEDGEEAEWNQPYSKRHHELHGAVSSWELDPLHKMTDSVYQARFVTEQQPNKQSVTFIPVEDIESLKQPGIYVAVMSKPGRFGYDYQTTYFYVSDLGVSLHNYPKGATVLVSSLVNGKGLDGVDVSWLGANGKVLAHAASNGEGRVDFAERPDKARVLLAEKGQQVSMLALREPSLDLSEFETGGDLYKPVRLFAYSGRDLYRPGEQFIASVLARDADGRPVPPQPIQATLRRPDGHNQLVSTLKPNAKQAGYYQQRIDIPADAPTGVWTLELRHDPADKLPGTIYRFSVEEFLPERMKLDLASDKPRLTGQDGLSIDINGAYLYGAPAAGNRLLGTVEYARSRNPLAAKLPGYVFGSIDDDNIAKRLELEENSLDDNGQAQVDVDVAPARGRQSAINIRSTFSLLESGGRPVVRSLERVWWPAPALLGVRPKFTRDYVPEGALAEFDVVLADGDARMLAQRGTPMRLIREDRNWYWRYDDQRGWNSGFDEVSELVSSQNIDLVAGKPFTLKLPVRYGRYRLEIGTPNGPGSAAYRFYAGWSAQRDQSDGVRPDRVALKL